MTPNRFFRLVLASSVLVLGGAWFFQLWVGLTPCELCLYERIPWYIATALCVVPARRRWAFWGVVALIAVFSGSSILGFYHVAVEQHWVAGPSACTAAPLTGLTVEELTRKLLETPVIRCDDIQWAWLGVSLAGWNAILSLALLVAGLIALWTMPKKA